MSSSSQVELAASPDRRSSATLDVDDVDCHEWDKYRNISGEGAFAYTIANEGIPYLKTVSGHKPKLEHGPDNCDRVSCSWGSAIYWCNEACYLCHTVPIQCLDDICVYNLPYLRDPLD